MPVDKKKIQLYSDTIEREVGEITSRQPRWNKAFDRNVFFDSVVRMTAHSDLTAPPYQPNSMRRDKWLRKFWPIEPHLGGVISQVVSIDKNRGWTLTGGRNQVNVFKEVLHGFNNNAGWRLGVGQVSESYYTSDMGGLTEIGRDNNGPMRALWHMDSTRCRLTGNADYPLEYVPANGKAQLWPSNDFFRVASMPSTDETYNGLGWCAVSRAIELAKIMIAVFRYDQEQLGARAPRGLLLLQNIGEDQWRTALQSRTEESSALGHKYFGGVMVLASEGVDQMDAKLVALSQLPSDFDRETATNFLMYSYALVVGYDPTEFWPVNAGVMGRGKETDIQQRKATGKGGHNFILDYQEQIQKQLPPTVHFEFEQRDTEGDQQEAELKKIQSETAIKLYEAGLKEGLPLLERDEARSLLADWGVISTDWTVLNEDEIATDTDSMERELKTLRSFALKSERTIRAIDKFKDEPIVRYSFDPKTMKGRTIVLWDKGSDAISKNFSILRNSTFEIDPARRLKIQPTSRQPRFNE